MLTSEIEWLWLDGAKELGTSVSCEYETSLLRPSSKTPSLLLSSFLSRVLIPLVFVEAPVWLLSLV